jgi:hypothetical protein
MNSEQSLAKLTNELVRVHDPTLLSKSAVYQIDGYLYHFLMLDPFSNINVPRYEFSPLNGQRRRKNLTLNRKQLLIKVYEVLKKQEKQEIN